MLARAGAGAALPAGLRLGWARARGAVGARSRDSRLCAARLSTSLAPLAGGTRRASSAPPPRSLSLCLSPSGGGAVLWKCGPGWGGGFKKPPGRVPPAAPAAPGSTSERRPPRNAARPAGGGRAEPAGPASLPPLPHAARRREGHPRPRPGSTTPGRPGPRRRRAGEMTSGAGKWGE